jgi:hypothetical protein
MNEKWGEKRPLERGLRIGEAEKVDEDKNSLIEGSA